MVTGRTRFRITFPSPRGPCPSTSSSPSRRPPSGARIRQRGTGGGRHPLRRLGCRPGCDSGTQASSDSPSLAPAAPVRAATRRPARRPRQQASLQRRGGTLPRARGGGRRGGADGNYQRQIPGPRTDRRCLAGTRHAAPARSMTSSAGMREDIRRIVFPPYAEQTVVSPALSQPKNRCCPPAEPRLALYLRPARRFWRSRPSLC